LNGLNEEKQKEINDLITKLEKENASLDKENEAVSPMEEEQKDGDEPPDYDCPFKDPRDSQSFLYL
jgi:hypothetical protein